jgi:hypothetical protein
MSNMSVVEQLKKLSVADTIEKEDLERIIEAVQKEKSETEEKQERLSRLQTEMNELRKDKAGDKQSRFDGTQATMASCQFEMGRCSNDGSHRVSFEPFSYKSSGELPESNLDIGYEGLRNRTAEARQFSMNSSQPLFMGKFSENVEDWLFTTEINMRAAGILEDRKVDIAAGYLRENALQVFKQIMQCYAYNCHGENSGRSLLGGSVRGNLMNRWFKSCVLSGKMARWTNT